MIVETDKFGILTPVDTERGVVRQLLLDTCQQVGIECKNVQTAAPKPCNRKGCSVRRTNGVARRDFERACLGKALLSNQYSGGLHRQCLVNPKKSREPCATDPKTSGFVSAFA